MIFVTVERAPLSSTTSRWLCDFTFFQYNRSPPYLLSILAITLGAVFFAWSQTNGGQAKKSELVPGSCRRSATPQRCTRYQDHFGRALHFYCLRYGERGAALYRRWNMHFEREFLHRTRRLRR